MNLQKNWK